MSWFLPKPSSRGSARLRLAVAASILLVIGLIVPALLNRGGKMEKTKVAGIELELSNGKKINLSESKGAIAADARDPAKLRQQAHLQPECCCSNGHEHTKYCTRHGLPGNTGRWLAGMAELNFHAGISFFFQWRYQEIKITGEALLKIAKNKEQPFIVHLPGSSVLVTGTEFNVNTFDPGTVKVALIEGSVMMTGGKHKMALQPGRQGVYENEKELYDQPFNQRNTLGWTKGLHYFEKVKQKKSYRSFPGGMV